MMRSISILLLVLVALCGCETTLNETQTGALTGTALGAGLGAIIGNQSGHAGAGTAIGAGAGALAGGLMGEGIRRSKQQQTYQNYPQQQVVPPPQPSGQIRQIHTKYNPVTGKTYPENFQYDPEDGTELRYIQ